MYLLFYYPPPLTESDGLTHFCWNEYSPSNLGQKQRRYCPGDRLNKKTLSYQYRDPPVKDKTISLPSYI